MDRYTRTPISYQDPQDRIHNFEEVCLGYTEEEAIEEANRCLKCKRPSCVPLCPVNIDIPAFIAEIAKGDFGEAARILAKYTALPAVCGRVCPQEEQCEKTCILGKKGEAIAIGKLERFAADWAIEKGLKFGRTEEKKGHRVAVVGSGPAGISCAKELVSLGYEVKIFEALHEPGGVLIYGIPEFRLPKERIVRVEIERLKELGVEIETNVVVGRTVTIDEIFQEGYEAIFIGSGAGLPVFMNIPGENLNGVFSANEFLTRCNLMMAYRKDAETPIRVGKKVSVIGGGNVAMDAARTARRLGAEVHLIYRRTEKELPARLEEVENAKEEGIIFNFLTNPLEILGDEEGWVRGMKCIRMELGEADESGRRRPIPIEGSEFVFETDTVIMALGTNPNPLLPMTTAGLQADDKNRIKVLEGCITSREGVFAGGDNVTGSATVILAMGAGKKAAKAIDEYISKKLSKKA